MSNQYIGVGISCLKWKMPIIHFKETIFQELNTYLNFNIENILTSDTKHEMNELNLLPTYACPFKSI